MSGTKEPQEKTEFRQIKHVGAGFMPAFKFKQKIVLVIERGHKARAYVMPFYCLS